jgi:hypothetical protein
VGFFFGSSDQCFFSFSGAGVTGGSITNGAYTVTITDAALITAVSDSRAQRNADAFPYSSPKRIEGPATFVASPSVIPTYESWGTRIRT